MEVKVAIYKVIAQGNFYESMFGKVVGTTDKTFILEFDLSLTLGGLQRVQFFKDQLESHGFY